MRAFVAGYARFATMLVSSLPLILSTSVADASRREAIEMDPVSLAYIAAKCEIPISPAHTVWLDDVKSDRYNADIADAEAMGAETLKTNSRLVGHRKACHRFRVTLAEAGWL